MRLYFSDVRQGSFTIFGVQQHINVITPKALLCLNLRLLFDTTSPDTCPSAFIFFLPSRRPCVREMMVIIAQTHMFILFFTPYFFQRSHPGSALALLAIVSEFLVRLSTCLMSTHKSRSANVHAHCSVHLSRAKYDFGLIARPLLDWNFAHHAERSQRIRLTLQ